MKIFNTLFLICCMQYAFGQTNWQLQKDDHGIKVYTAESASSSVKLLRVEVEFTQSIEKVTSNIMNVSEYKYWVYGCIESTTLLKPNDSIILYRHVTDAPWPFEDRDLVSQFTKTKNKTSGTITITSTLKKDYPEQEGFVRITHSSATWVFIPQKNGKVKVIYNLSFDPGGNIPAWLINLFITDGPYQSFLNLQKRLGE